MKPLNGGGVQFQSLFACRIDLCWMTSKIVQEPADERQQQQQQEQQQQQQQDRFVYTHDIYIPTKMPEPSKLTLAVAITFNLAVVHHMAALHLDNEGVLTSFDNGNTTKAQILQQALTLYQYSFRLQQTQARSSQLPLFFMACINNIVILLIDLGESHQALEECFHHLLALLMMCRNTMIVFIDIKVFESFVQNTSRRGVSAGSTP